MAANVELLADLLGPQPNYTSHYRLSAGNVKWTDCTFFASRYYYGRRGEVAGRWSQDRDRGDPMPLLRCFEIIAEFKEEPEFARANWQLLPLSKLESR